MSHSCLHPNDAQHTLAKPIHFMGIGLHSGEHCSMTVEPASIDHGLVFAIMHNDGSTLLIPADHHYITSTNHATCLSHRGESIRTIEHILSALYGMGIDNALIRIKGPEVPAMDGSAKAFTQGITHVGRKQQQQSRNWLIIDRDIEIKLTNRHVKLSPFSGFKITYTMPRIMPYFAEKTLTSSMIVDPNCYASDIAWARTFGDMNRHEQLKSQGLAQGASYDNCIALGRHRVENPGGLRAPDECIKHKMLDAIGDLALIGRPIKGHYMAFGSGHHLHHLLCQKLDVCYGLSTVVRH